jgi:hypothetical protein
MSVLVSLAHGSGAFPCDGRLGHRDLPGVEETVWRTGRGADALAVLFMQAAETKAAF